ncbi:hypothetical protein [Mycobacterium sp. E3198]|uniref:hypothetical protein n=1 Tax=Mycobacterium sp. E3198 TaxID=1834143 RepID=UPI0012EAB081
MTTERSGAGGLAAARTPGTFARDVDGSAAGATRARHRGREVPAAGTAGAFARDG